MKSLSLLEPEFVYANTSPVQAAVALFETHYPFRDMVTAGDVITNDDVVKRAGTRPPDIAGNPRPLLKVVQTRLEFGALTEGEKHPLK